MSKISPPIISARLRRSQNPLLSTEIKNVLPKAGLGPRSKSHRINLMRLFLLTFVQDLMLINFNIQITSKVCQILTENVKKLPIHTVFKALNHYCHCISTNCLFDGPHSLWGIILSSEIYDYLFILPAYPTTIWQADVSECWPEIKSHDKPW